MTTRYEDKKTYQVEYDDKWIEKDDEWELPVFKVNNIENGTTNIELIKLRSKLNEDKISQLRLHLGAIYSKFLRSKNVSIKLNSSKITPIDFENWAYPPNYEPRNYSGVVHTQNGKNVRVNAIAGLSKESSPAGGEYGVYIYCNDRLIAKALKNYDVGFTKGLAGKPHPDLSLTRVIVSINGEARLMPWNSSKSDINTTHEVFIAIRDWLVQVVKDYASLSRRFSHSEGGWPKEVFRYPKGKIIEVAVSDFPTARTSYLPQLPITKPRFGNIIKKENKDISKKKPWTTGLYESIIAVDLLSKQKLEQKNRINLIILDSTLEIAFKEYLVNDSGEQCSNRRLQEIFSNRIQVHNEIKNTDINISDDIWRKILYYYNMRSLIIHQKATVSVSDSDIETFRSIVEDVLSKLFELKF